MNLRNLQAKPSELRELISLANTASIIMFRCKAEGYAAKWMACDYESHVIDIQCFEYKALTEKLTTYTMVTVGEVSGKVLYGATLRSIKGFGHQNLQNATYFLKTVISADGTVSNFRYDKNNTPLPKNRVVVER